tara:strand:- start:428 stop:952 length:525 start_codon:yes stop_codon:yes gene_type:complete
MKIFKTKFKDTYLIDHSKKNDKRGFFMRGICTKILKNKNILFNIKQTNYSYNKKKLTLRGFHFQLPPFSEKKIITCVNGKLLLVIVNIDKKSKNYLKHLKFILSDDLNRSVLISKNCATAFLTLEPETLVYYYMSSYYKKSKGRGIRYNDPKLKINWPKKPKIISSRDLNFENL